MLIAKSMEKSFETNEWTYKICQKSHKDKARIRRHTDSHFPGFNQACPQCGKNISSRNALRCHMYDQHNENMIIILVKKILVC